MLLLPAGPITACRPEGQRPVCSQCRRDIKPDDGSEVVPNDLGGWCVPEGVTGWHHVADGTPRCPVGLAEAVRCFARFVTGHWPL